jgi:uncharacterized protein (DUF433 family)
MEGSMKTYEKIEMNPKIMFGKPVIKNTRITVEHILRKLSGGMTIEEIMSFSKELVSKRHKGRDF